MLCCEKPDTKLLRKRLPAFNKCTPKPIFGSLRGSVRSLEHENSSPVSPSRTCRGRSPPADAWPLPRQRSRLLAFRQRFL